jgi:hypothetical protein
VAGSDLRLGDKVEAASCRFLEGKIDNARRFNAASYRIYFGRER